MNTEALIEQVVGAFRERDPDGNIKWATAWFDLEGEDRRRAFEATQRQRQLEAALDPDGLSSTGHAVLARLGLRP